MTAGKLAEFLEVSLDQLLEEDAISKTPERVPVVEQPVMKNIILVLYGLIAFSYGMILMNAVINALLGLEVIETADLLIQGIRMALFAVRTVIFVWGFLVALRNRMTPRRTGGVISVYFLSMMVPVTLLSIPHHWQLTVVSFLRMIPYGLGALAGYRYFCRADGRRRWQIMLFFSVLWGFVTTICNLGAMIKYAPDYVSMSSILNAVLNLLIFTLVLYQLLLLRRKRKMAEKVC